MKICNFVACTLLAMPILSPQMGFEWAEYPWREFPKYMPTGSVEAFLMFLSGFFRGHFPDYVKK